MGPDELEALLKQPEGEELEFKSGRVRPEVVAGVLGAFANSKGGVLIWGFDERNDTIVGVDDPEFAEQQIKRGLSLVTPQPDAAIQRVDLRGVPLIVAQVARTPGHLYLANRQLLGRRGNHIEPLSSERLRQLTSNAGRSHARGEDGAQSENIRALVGAIDNLQGDIAYLKKQNSLWRRIGIALAGAAFGALVRSLIELLT